jgi:heptosyltransferase-3
MTMPSGPAQSPTPVALPARPSILVVTLRRTGDVLLTTPLIRSFRQQWPNATIDVLTFAGASGILAGNPDIDQVITMSDRPTVTESLRLLLRLWKRYDLAVSTQSGDRPTLFALTAGRTHAGVIDPDDGNISARLKRSALHRASSTPQTIHRVEQMLALADALGITRSHELVGPAADPAFAVPNSDFAVIHAAPMFRYKQWTAEGWRALAAHLAQRGLAIVAIGGPDERERRYLEYIWQGITDVRQQPWPGTAALLARARIYIGPDTSVSHLAAAAGCPTVVLFGPTDPRVWGPWPVGGLDRPWQARGTIQNRGNVWVVQNPLPCLPCTFEGCERHINSHSQCLDELTPAQVLAAVDEALSVDPLPRAAAEPAG